MIFSWICGVVAQRGRSLEASGDKGRLQLGAIGITGEPAFVDALALLEEFFDGPERGEAKHAEKC